MSNNLTRRAVLRGSAIAVAATATTILPIAASAALPHPDPVLETWRAWRPLEEEATRLIVERDRIWDALPDNVKHPTVTFDVPWSTDGKPITWYDSMETYDSFATIGSPRWQEWAAAYRPTFQKDLRLARRRTSAAIKRSGWTALLDRIAAIHDRQQPLWVAIRDSAGSSPVAIAAKLDVGLSFCDRTDFLADVPHRLTCSVIRDLLPQLPPDMAAALEPIAAERGTIREAHLRGTTAEIGGAA